MAGVGFSLRALGAEPGLQGVVRLYGCASLISSGPWLVSVSILLLTGMTARWLAPDPLMVQRFQVCVTWMFAASLILGAPLALAFTRYVADRTYANQTRELLPNLLGALVAMTSAACLFASFVSPLFPEESWPFKIALGTSFVLLCDTWIVIVMLNDLREHQRVLKSFLFGYAVTFSMTTALARWGETGMLTGFGLGQACLLFSALRAIMQNQAACGFIAWDFLRRQNRYPDLVLAGFVYNLSIWIDKLFFWTNPDTSRQIVGPLRASEMYDLPIFLAYLTTVPAMAVFLVRVETDFAEKHRAFYQAIRDGAPLRQVEQAHEVMSDAARRAIFDIIKTEALVLVAVVTFGKGLLAVFGLSELHVPLFQIDALGVGLQVLFLAVISMFFYLDRRKTVLALTATFLLANAGATWLTQRAGPAFYGYGFVVGVGISSIVGLSYLSRVFGALVRETFMHQRVGS